MSVTCDYMMSGEPEAVVNVRTVPGGSIPDFPAMQIGPFCLYPTMDQLHDILMQIDDYLEVKGYYEQAQFEDVAERGAKLDVEELFATADAEAEAEFIAVPAEAAIG